MCRGCIETDNLVLVCQFMTDWLLDVLGSCRAGLFLN